jgi:hypothetical protein
MPAFTLSVVLEIGSAIAYNLLQPYIAKTIIATTPPPVNLAKIAIGDGGKLHFATNFYRA